jgi:hypothetical protein
MADEKKRISPVVPADLLREITDHSENANAAE